MPLSDALTRPQGALGSFLLPWAAHVAHVPSGLPLSVAPSVGQQTLQACGSHMNDYLR